MGSDQLSLDVPQDPNARVERAARALYLQDARRSGIDTKGVWERLKPHYLNVAEAALEAADGKEIDE